MDTAKPPALSAGFAIFEPEDRRAREAVRPLFVSIKLREAVRALTFVLMTITLSVS
jgi:hypothetical protein